MGLHSLSGLEETVTANQFRRETQQQLLHPMDCEGWTDAGRMLATAGVKQREILFSTARNQNTCKQDSDTYIAGTLPMLGWIHWLFTRDCKHLRLSL